MGKPRPEFIKHYSEIQEPPDSSHYKGSKEFLSIGSPFAKKFGLNRLGIHHEVLPPGRRTSWPHAESLEQEFVYVIEGHPDAWINGELYPLNPGDGVGFPDGTGISHTFINNTESDVRLLVVGETSKDENKVYYPLNPSRREQCKDSWWHDIPKHDHGPHDGMPDKVRTQVLSPLNFTAEIPPEDLTDKSLLEALESYRIGPHRFCIDEATLRDLAPRIEKAKVSGPIRFISDVGQQIIEI